MNIFQSLFGGFGGLTNQDLDRLSRRDKFSDYLPYLAYDPARKMYYNIDDTVGFLWECSSLAFADGATLQSLSGLFRYGFPTGTIIQFIVHADDYVDPYLNAYLNLKIRENDIVKNASLSYARFLREGRLGMRQMSGVPLRNFRLFCAVKIPVDAKSQINLDDAYNTISELLKGASLYPAPLAPGGLVEWLRRLMNNVDGLSPHIVGAYDDEVPLRKQVILAETEIKKHMSSMQVGPNVFRCTTVKSFPREVDPMQTNQLLGGIWGVASDGNQIQTPFLYTMNIVFHPLKTKLHAKCNLVLQQQGVGSFAPTLQHKKDEYLWATDELERGTPFVRIIPMVWTWAPTEKAASESIARIKRLWEHQGYVMQEDRGILPLLFISALPFGLYDKKGNIDNLDRDFIAPESSVTPILPLQSDFAGGGEPYLVLVGRKGQLSTLDIFGKGCDNNNIFIAASSGSGKSFFVNYLVFNYYAANALIRIIDIGGSYKKMTNMWNARYLDFDENSDVCLNPFTNIDSFEEEKHAISAMVLQMAFSATDSIPVNDAETIHTMVKLAVTWAWTKYGREADIDKVHFFLASYPNVDEEARQLTANQVANDDLVRVAQLLAINLGDFVSSGTYGKWFNGPSTFDISQDEFVVLELEHLKPKKELFKVVTLQIINAVTQDLYLSDRSRKRLICFDEAWQFLKDGSQLKDVIEEGYRRARKYGGSFCVITQSLMDLKQFGSVGNVIRANSAFKFYLASPDLDRAQAEGFLDCDPFVLGLMKTVRSNKPKYSELWVDSPFGSGVLRLAVDAYSYYVYTSDAAEIAEIEALVKSGMPYAEAIAAMVAKYRS